MLVLNGKEVLKGVRGDALRKAHGRVQTQFTAAREVLCADTPSSSKPHFSVQSRFHGSTRAELFAPVLRHGGNRRGR